MFYIFPPPPPCVFPPLGGLLERPCVSLCAYRLQVFPLDIESRGFSVHDYSKFRTTPLRSDVCCSIFSLSLNASLFLIRSILDQLGMRYAVFRRDLHELEPQTLQISLFSALVSVIEAFWLPPSSCYTFFCKLVMIIYMLYQMPKS